MKIVIAVIVVAVAISIAIFALSLQSVDQEENMVRVAFYPNIGHSIAIV